MFNNILALPLILVFSLASCASFEQTPPALLAEPLTYVYEFPSEEKSELFNKSRLWVAETYNSAEAVMTFEDQESGTIKGTGVGAAVWSMYERKFKYNISIDVRDGKTRLQFSNFKPLHIGNLAGINPSYREAFEIIKRTLNQTANSYQRHMQKEPNDDW